MKQMTHHSKLKRGASLTIALIIFLLCALAGASAIMMAATNAGRYSHREEQEYYSVSSAALLIVDMFDDVQYTSETVNWEYAREWTFEEGEGHASKDGYTLTVPQLSYPFTNLEHNRISGRSVTSSKLELCGRIQKQCDLLVPYLNVPVDWYARVEGQDGAPKKPSSVARSTYKFTMDVKNDKRYDTVNCTLYLNDNYDLLFSFDGGNGEYALSLYWEARVTVTQETGEPTYTYTEKEGDAYKTGKMTQTGNLTVAVKWKRENVTISRGAIIEGGTTGE